MLTDGAARPRTLHGVSICCSLVQPPPSGPDAASGIQAELDKETCVCFVGASAASRPRPLQLA